MNKKLNDIMALDIWGVDKESFKQLPDCRCAELESENKALKEALEQSKVLVNMICKRHPDGSWPAFSMTMLLKLATNLKQSLSEAEWEDEGGMTRLWLLLFSVASFIGIIIARLID